MSAASTSSPFLEHFDREYAPLLDCRGPTFRIVFDELVRHRKSSYLIVETGCVRQQDDWSAGQSTLLFDDFVNVHGGHVISVDISPENCAHARSRCSARTSIVLQDSVSFLAHWARQVSTSVDCVYLDSMDVDWNFPEPAALHHLFELCAVQPALRSGSLVIVDDHHYEGRRGKSLFVEEYMKRAGSRCLFADRQIAWVVP